MFNHKTLLNLFCVAGVLLPSVHAEEASQTTNTPKAASTPRKKEVPVIQKMIQELPAAKVPSEPGKFDVYLLVGQSNMAGRGILTPADEKPDPRVLTFNAKDRWVNQGEPLHFDKAEAGVGPGFAFAKCLAEKTPGVTIGLVPCAIGGSKIEQWQPGQFSFERAVKRTQLALKQGGTLRGILWHQGESSCKEAARVESYGQELTQIIEGFRKALGTPDVPFIAGELGEFIYASTGNPFARKSPFALELNAQVDALPGRVSNTAVVSSVGLTPNADLLHFDAASQKELGKRYCETLLRLTEKK